MANVAPHMGAWIEINQDPKEQINHIVAPHMGAWIEISFTTSIHFSTLSHPTWVRGLKFVE